MDVVALSGARARPSSKRVSCRKRLFAAEGHVGINRSRGAGILTRRWRRPAKSEIQTADHKFEPAILSHVFSHEVKLSRPWTPMSWPKSTLACCAKLRDSHVVRTQLVCCMMFLTMAYMSLSPQWFSTSRAEPYKSGFSSLDLHSEKSPSFGPEASQTRQLAKATALESKCQGGLGRHSNQGCPSGSGGLQLPQSGGPKETTST